MTKYQLYQIRSLELSLVNLHPSQENIHDEHAQQEGTLLNYEPFLNILQESIFQSKALQTTELIHH
jgi:hypothetical protein